ncbi:MAG: 5'-nucleotidase [Firmicutes bacterium ADurb.BinA205]|nr:MAG: 5'-nucleotidase [Firmicutes bacterium ADurb.BinA205]
MANLVFDYDGTLHNSMLTYAPAFRDTMKWLSDSGYIADREYSDKEISYWLGFNSTDMWGNFHPELDITIRETARKKLGENMAHRLDSGEGALYTGAEEMLTALKNAGHTIIFLSNCRVHYMERAKRLFGLEKWFDHFYCCEEFDFIPKYEIFRRFAPDHKGEYIIIGDRFHDIETAAQNGLRSIGCSYGYGSREELSKADIIVDTITDIPNAVEKLTEA